MSELPIIFLSNLLTLFLIDVTAKVIYGSCNDSFSIPKASQEKLKNNPPVELNEVYYNCRNSDRSVFIDSIGVAAGAMGLYVPLIVFMTLLLLRAYSRHKRQTVATTYSNDEQQEVLNFLAFNLLLARDGKYELETDEYKSIVHQLRAELGKRAAIRRFYADDNKEADSSEVSRSESKPSEGGDVELSAVNDQGGLKSVAKAQAKRAADKISYISNPMFSDDAGR
jgi:hypothetical protein